MMIPPNRITVFPLKDDLAWYDPEVVFLPTDDIFGRGVVGTTDLQVVANGGGDGQISVQAGRGYVPYSSGGKRLFKTSVAIRSDAAEFLTAIPAWAGGNPRVHRIIARIKDATITPADAIKGGVFDVLPGIATAGATLVNLSGAQAVPADSLLLGNVLQNGATNPAGNIDSTFGTVRARARIGAGNSPSHGFEVGGAALTDRQNLNLIAGTGISIGAVDNPGADSADVTISGSVPEVKLLWSFLVSTATKASIDSFSDNASILLSQAYKMLVIRGQVKCDAVGNDQLMYMQLNNDTGTNYDNGLWELTGNVLSDIDYNNSEDHIVVTNVIGTNFPHRWSIFEIKIIAYSETGVGISPLSDDESFATMLIDAASSWGGGSLNPIRRYWGGAVWAKPANTAITRFKLYFPSAHFIKGSCIQVYGSV